jgi:hypothetical protein
VIVIIYGSLRLAVTPPIQQTDFFASFDARNTADGVGRRANTL